MAVLNDALWHAFFGYAGDRVQALNAGKKSVAHYTTAETALNVVKGRSIWLRNAAVMNDHMEIEYGKSIIDPALAGDQFGRRFKAALDAAHPGISEEIIAAYERAKLDARESIFMTSLSEHPANDRLGRLSMWRAYGGQTAGVALIFNRTVVTHAAGTPLATMASPIFYGDQTDFLQKFLDLITTIEREVRVLAACDPKHVKDTATAALKFAMLSIKHPGFREEEEWRLIHLPSEGGSEHVVPSIVSVRGIPQKIYQLPFHNPQKGALFNLPSLTLNGCLESIIIGPRLHPETVRRAFVDELTAADIPNAFQRVHVSSIPLRQWG